MSETSQPSKTTSADAGKPAPEPTMPEPTTPEPRTPAPAVAADDAGANVAEIGGPRGPEPTRYGDWERKGRCVDF